MCLSSGIGKHVAVPVLNSQGEFDMRLKVFLPMAAVLLLDGCGGESDVRANDASCEVDLRVTLSGASNNEFNPIEGVGYLNSRGFEMAQYLADNHGGLAVDTGGDGLGDVMSFLSGNVNAMGKKGTIIFVNTLKAYSDGETLGSGVYVYDGTVSYQGADGAQHTVRAFHQMEEELAQEKIAACEERKKLERQERERQKTRQEELEKRKREEEDRMARPVDGETLPLPDKHKVRSICGIEFGVPPAKAESNLGERIDGRPIAVQLKKDQWNLCATYKLKKQFRNFDRAKIYYAGRPPYCVVSAVELLGYVNKDSVSAISCQAEVKKVAELLNEHYKLGGVHRTGSDWAYDVGARARVRTWEDEPNNILVTYSQERGEFKIRIAKDFLGRINELLELDRKRKDAEKGNVEFGDKAGADAL